MWCVVLNNYCLVLHIALYNIIVPNSADSAADVLLVKPWHAN